MTSDEAHTTAAKYANERRDETSRFREEHGGKPYRSDLVEAVWLAHYEGFRAALGVST